MKTSSASRLRAKQMLGLVGGDDVALGNYLDTQQNGMIVSGSPKQVIYDHFRHWKFQLCGSRQRSAIFR